MDEPRQATEEQIAAAAWDTVPQVAPLFWAFRVMVGLGFYFILLMGVFFWLSARRKLDAYPWLLKVAVWTIPLPWLAAECGWFVAEFGRQPWTVNEMLPTWLSVSTHSTAYMAFSLGGFLLLYTIFAIVEMFLMLRVIRQGPGEHAPEATGRPAAAY